MAVKRTRTKAGTKSLLADAAAGDILRRAASAVDLELEDLINLAVDAGASVAPPQADHATERFTLEDLGSRMWTLMATTAPSERPAWFEGLVETQKVSLLVFLRHRGYSSSSIAREFEIDPQTVQATYNRMADELGTQVVNVRLNTIVGQLQIAAERASEGAMQKDDWSTFWRIQKELIGLLQSLGIVDQAIHRVKMEHEHKHDHTVKFEEQARAEIDRIVALERKKLARSEELKRLEVTVDAPKTDDVPAELAPKVRAQSMDQPFVDEEYLDDIEDDA